MPVQPWQRWRARECVNVQITGQTNERWVNGNAEGQGKRREVYCPLLAATLAGRLARRASSSQADALLSARDDGKLITSGCVCKVRKSMIFFCLLRQWNIINGPWFGPLRLAHWRVSKLADLFSQTAGKLD